jgi:hypothetical protein
MDSFGSVYAQKAASHKNSSKPSASTKGTQLNNSLFYQLDAQIIYSLF